jgi:hypothetical protein
MKPVLSQLANRLYIFYYDAATSAASASPPYMQQRPTLNLVVACTGKIITAANAASKNYASRVRNYFKRDYVPETEAACLVPVENDSDVKGLEGKL